MSVTPGCLVSTEAKVPISDIQTALTLDKYVEEAKPLVKFT